MSMIPSSPSPLPVTSDSGASPASSGSPSDAGNTKSADKFAAALDKASEKVNQTQPNKQADSSTSQTQAKTDEPAKSDNPRSDDKGAGTDGSIAKASTTAQLSQLQIVANAEVSPVDPNTAAATVAVAQAATAPTAQTSELQTRVATADTTTATVVAPVDSTTNPASQSPDTAVATGTAKASENIDVQTGNVALSNGAQDTKAQQPVAGGNAVNGNGGASASIDLLQNAFSNAVTSDKSTAAATKDTKAELAASVSPTDATAAKSVIDALGTTAQPRTTEVLNNVNTTNNVSNPLIARPTHEQVAQIVAPLRNHGDGSYTMTLHLHPEELGHVEIAVTIQNSQVNLSMSADNPNARQALRDSMNDLRSSLSSAGLDAGALDVSSRDTGQSQNGFQDSSGHSTNRNTVSGNNSADEDTTLLRFNTSEVSATTKTDGPLDVRV